MDKPYRRWGAFYKVSRTVDSGRFNVIVMREAVTPARPKPTTTPLLYGVNSL